MQFASKRSLCLVRDSSTRVGPRGSQFVRLGGWIEFAIRNGFADILNELVRREGGLIKPDTLPVRVEGESRD